MQSQPLISLYIYTTPHSFLYLYILYCTSLLFAKTTTAPHFFVHRDKTSLLYAKTAPNFFVHIQHLTHSFIHIIQHLTSLCIETKPHCFMQRQHLTSLYIYNISAAHSFIHIIQHLTSLCIDNNNSLLYAHAKSHFFVHIFNTSFFSYIYVTIVYILPLFITYLSYINIYYTGSSIPSPVRSYNQ